MNTILCIIIAIFYGLDNLCLDRLGTHCLELFFGLVRGFSKGIDGWPAFYRKIGKTIMAHKSLNELQIKPKITHRANLAGVIIQDTLDISLYPMLSQDAMTMAKNLFEYLIYKNDNSNIMFRFESWIISMSEYLPNPKKYTNPTSGVKIIAHIINASKKDQVDQDVDDDDDESDDDDEEDENEN